MRPLTAHFYYKGGYNVHWGENFKNEYLEELRSFLGEALEHASYGSSGVQSSEYDSADFLRYQRGWWAYEDSWYGGQPFSGLAIVYYHQKACWTLAYRGKVFDAANKRRVLECLRPSLRAYDPTRPLRGPGFHMAENGLRYINYASGDIDEFDGEEKIFDSNSVIYKMNYHGGLVDLK